VRIRYKTCELGIHEVSEAYARSVNRLTGTRKVGMLRLVAMSPLPVRQTLEELKLSSATYYRRRRRCAVKGPEGLQIRRYG
jgi:hypothetical protein